MREINVQSHLETYLKELKERLKSRNEMTIIIKGEKE